VLRFDKRWPYKAIADKYSISIERVRQICNGPDVKEDLLLKVAEAYSKKFKNKKEVGAKEILEDIIQFSNQDRKKSTVIKRNALIVYLYDELHLSFMVIGKLLERDHTSIMHSYESYYKKQ